MYTIIFKNEASQVQVHHKTLRGESLLDIALLNDIDITCLCGGNGVCKSCKVCIEQGEEFIHLCDLAPALSPGEPVFACQTYLCKNSTGTIVVNLENGGA